MTDKEPNKTTDEKPKVLTGDASSLDGMVGLVESGMKALLSDLSLDELTTVYNKHSDAKTKRLSDKTSGFERTIKALKSRGINSEKRLKRALKRILPRLSEKAPRPPSKVEKLRLCFADPSVKSVTTNALMKASGYDEKGVRYWMSSLANPKRTREERLLLTEFDKEKGVFKRVKEAKAATKA